MEAALKMGYRFHPTKEEIVSYFLGEKLCGRVDNVRSINEVYINNFEPWDLPDRAALQSNDPVWYFFTKPDYMDARRMKVNRKTEAGFWKVTGKDREVKDKCGRVIGTSKTLVFHRSRTPRTPGGVRTHWVIQEFHHKEADKWGQRHFVLCRLKRKSDDGDEPNPPQLAPNSGNCFNVSIIPLENNELRLELQPGSLFNNDEPSALHFLIGRAQGPSRSNESSRSQLYITDQEVDSMLASGEYQQLHEENQLEADLMGYRFHPTEEEIISYFLGEKLCGRDDNVRSINEVDINNFEPWDLRDRAALQSNDPLWYFFTKPDYMDAGRMRVNRKTEAGFWKVTGEDREVKDKRGRVIGTKKTLVFHRSRTPRTPGGVRTPWVIQEFHHKEADKWGQRHFVLCRLKKKSKGGDEQQGQEFVNSLLADWEGEYSFEETVNTRQVYA